MPIDPRWDFSFSHAIAPADLFRHRARERFDIGEYRQLSLHRWKSSGFDGLLFGHNVQFDQID
jgi:hypothetical protein